LKTGFLFVEFNVVVYRSIAREAFYNFGIWWNLIGGRIQRENHEKRELIVKISFVLVKRSFFKA